MPTSKYLKGPDWAWDTLFETLNLDAESSAFSEEIRADLRRALNKVGYLDVPPKGSVVVVPHGYRTLVVPPSDTTLSLTPKERRYLTELLGPEIQFYTENKLAPNVPQDILKKMVGARK